MSTNNPLETLLVDETQGIDLTLLADILKPFVVIDKNKKEVNFLPGFYKLKNEERILIVLAAAKAKAELFQGDDKLSQKEVINLDLMPEGSVKGTLKKLYDNKEVKAENSKYYLASYQLNKLSERIKKYNED